MSALRIFGQAGAPQPSADFGGNVHLVTLGCSKNLVDSEVMLGSLTSRGFRPVSEPEEADLIVVNTCAFLQSAVDEGIDTILDLSHHKQQRCRKLVVAGCMVERYRDELKKSLPEVDHFVSTDELSSLDLEQPATAACLDAARRPYFLYDDTMPRVLSTAQHMAYVKLSEGCDRPCRFCIIPKIRGALRSREMDSVVREVTELHQAGVREVNFIAQDLTAYGTDWGRKPSLLPLLENLHTQFSGKSLWMRLFYAYPVGVDESLMSIIRDSPVIASYLDMPLQHISASVLKGMARPLGGKGTRKLIENMQAKFPEVALRTTFIVGYPGETEEDVQELEDFIREGHFAHVGVFGYSHEPEAASANLEGKLEQQVIEDRRLRLLEAQKEVVDSRLKAFTGRPMRVLFEGVHPETELLLAARAEWQGPEVDGIVIINDAPEGFKAEAGEFLDVEVSGHEGCDLLAAVVDPEAD